jgi:hypothetical protein
MRPLPPPRPGWLVADVAERDVGSIRVGSAATATLVSGEILSGRVRLVARDADPATRTDPMLATVNWREPPLQEPEAEIVGIEYGCAEARADLVLTNTDGWVYQGTDARNGQRLPRLVGVEFDELAPRDITPPGVEVFAASPVVCRQARYQQVTVYRSTASGAGVFAAGTIDWNCGLDGTCADIEAFGVVRGITANVLAVFASGPAGRLHPSTENAARAMRPTPVAAL